MHQTERNIQIAGFDALRRDHLTGARHSAKFGDDQDEDDSGSDEGPQIERGDDIEIEIG